MSAEVLNDGSGSLLTRRAFVQLAAVAGAALGAEQSIASEAASDSIAQAFDREMEGFLKTMQTPGGALAVVKGGRLVYARGYGWADRENREPVHADSLFRLASISKPITAVAVMKLVERRKLSLEARAFDLLGLTPLLLPGTEPDPRLASITVRHLLQHTGGWDRDQSFDPMFRSALIAAKVGSPSPANSVAVIRYMLGQPLDFTPGTRYAYSNFGYCVLGRIIEHVTRRGYERFVRDEILAPIGIRRMRIGASLASGRAPKEVCYYTRDNSAEESVFPSVKGKVPVQYGGFDLAAMDANGGWIGSAVDLARFVAALDPDSRHPFLQPTTQSLMQAPPPSPVSRHTDGSMQETFYSCGWLTRPVKDTGRASYWHMGALPGTFTLLVRRWDGLSWVALFNQISKLPDGSGFPDSAIDPALHRAAASVKTWPTEDLFRKW